MFFDSNVLVYMHDTREPAKRIKAVELFQSVPPELVALSGQVLGEFYWTVTRKLPNPLSPTAAQTVIFSFSKFNVIPIDAYLVREAVDLAHASQLAYWDALIVRAASVAGCAKLFTEDLNHGQVIDGVRIENPFL